MKKILFFLICTSLKLYSSSLEEVVLGQETIKPLTFAKSFAAFDINLYKNLKGFNNSNISGRIRQYINAQLGFEMGLFSYLNAGGIYELSVNSDPTKLGSIVQKLSFFAKPFYPLGERVSIFSRIRAGFLYAMSNELEKVASSEKLYAKRVEAYKNSSYFMQGLGASVGASIGIDYFPWSRVGFFAEWGIKTDFIFHKREKKEIHNIEDLIEGPSWQGYMIYDLPLTIGLYIIF